MPTALIIFFLGMFFVVSGITVAALAAYYQERLFDRLSQRRDMRSFIFETRNNASGALRLGGLISFLVGLGSLLVALVVWLVSIN